MLQASDLFERTVTCLSRLAQHTEVDEGLAQQQRIEAYGKLAAARDGALRCLQFVVLALDAWAQPIKESSRKSAEQAVSAPSSNVCDCILVTLFSPTQPPPQRRSFFNCLVSSIVLIAQDGKHLHCTCNCRPSLWLLLLTQPLTLALNVAAGKRAAAGRARLGFFFRWRSASLRIGAFGGGEEPQGRPFSRHLNIQRGLAPESRQAARICRCVERWVVM